MNPIVSARPTIEEADILAVADQLRSGHLEDGDAVRNFESAVASKVRKPHAIATINGFSAIHLTLLAMNVGTGDEIIIPNYSCPALLHAVRHTGAVPVFADIASGTFAMSAETVALVITPRTRAIILVYLFGFPAEIAPLKAAFPDVAIIEDIAQGLGVSHQGEQLGSRSTFAVASFYASKMVTAGDGGMVLTSSAEVAERCRELVYYGGKRGPRAIGLNYHLTNLNAALGLSQLARIDRFIARRRELAAIYDECLVDGEMVSRRFNYSSEAAYLRYPILLPDRRTRDLVKEDMAKQDIHCGFGVLEALHEVDGQPGAFPNSRVLTDRLLCLPIYPSLADADAWHVARVFQDVASHL